MKNQRLLVTAIPWRDHESAQCTLELSAPGGTRVTCFCEGCNAIEVGAHVEVETFYWLSSDFDPACSLDEILCANPSREKRIEPLSEWDHFLKGQIVEIEGRTAIVDCGGVCFPLHDFGADQRAVGAWIGVRVERLEVEIARS